MFFPLMIQAASWAFVLSPVVGVVVAIASAVSDHRFNKSIGR